MDLVNTVPVVVVLAAGVVAAVTDAVHFRIHNALTMPMILGGIVFHLMTSGASGFVFSVGGVLFALLALLLPYLIGAIGGGDVKLLGGIGAWLGVEWVAVVFFVAAIAGALYSIAMMTRRGRLRESTLGLRIAVCQLASLSRHLGAEDRVEDVAIRPDRRERLVPFAVMIAIGLVVALAWGVLT